MHFRDEFRKVLHAQLNHARRNMIASAALHVARLTLVRKYRGSMLGVSDK